MVLLLHSEAASARRPRSPSKGVGPGPEPPRPAFEGDLSEWGKVYEDEDEEAGSEAGSAATTLSSGISPLGGRPAQRPARPFELEAAQQALSYSAGMFGRAQAMRREGQSPAAIGVADDLPTRMAYEQLNILAGMAGKVGGWGQAA